MRPADFFESAEKSTVKCVLCPHNCVIQPGKTGLCGVRVNESGVLLAQSYGRITSIALDPIEKKPLYHFYPESMILSVGSYGCNFRCGFCQNHGISMHKAPYREMQPEELAGLSLELAENGSIGVAYTYNEPVISYEFVRDCARLIRLQGQKNVLVTNGFINREPLMRLLPLIDAMNIDLKSFSPGFYSQIGGDLEDVKQTISIAADKCHIEVTTLIVPGLNYSPDEMDMLAAWLAGVDKDIPLHISRFFPSYKMADLRPTPVETIRELAKTAKNHLRHVYMGNC